MARAPGLETAFIEGFNGCLHDESLNSHVFGSVAEAEALMNAWRDDYKRTRPHSASRDRTPIAWAQYLTVTRFDQ